MATKKVLIISHTFPPSPGIGGRRWAKFAKYLNREGVEVFVLKEQRKNSNNLSAWADDIKELQTKQIYTYKTFYPKILQKKHLGFWDKIYYKLAFLLVSLITKGNPFDKVAFIKRRFLNQLDYIVKQNQIRNIVVSGAPFNLLYYCALYKESNNQINLIVDFRDGWTWDGRYGINLLNKKQREVEGRKELFVFRLAETIYISANYHLSKVKEIYSNYFYKTKLLSHGFDVDDMPNVEVSVQKQNFIIYGGTLYDGLENVFKAINKSLHLAPENLPKEFHLYVNNIHKLEYYLGFIDKEYHSFFVAKKQLKPKDFYLEVVKAKYFLYWGGFELKLSSKVFEILYCNTPIIGVGGKGELSEFLLKQKLGLFFSPDEFDFNKIDLSKIDLSNNLNGNIMDYRSLAINVINDLKYENKQ